MADRVADAVGAAVDQADVVDGDSVVVAEVADRVDPTDDLVVRVDLAGPERKSQKIKIL